MSFWFAGCGGIGLTYVMMRTGVRSAGLYVNEAREALSPLERLEHQLHPWASFMIIPLFALANAGVPFQIRDIGEPIAVATVVGLVLGKPFGIVMASWIAVQLGWARLPDGVSWGILTGGSLGGSLVAGAMGMSLLYWLLPSPKNDVSSGA